MSKDVLKSRQAKHNQNVVLGSREMNVVRITSISNVTSRRSRLFFSSRKGQIKIIFPLIAALFIIVILSFVGFKGVNDVMQDKALIDLIRFSDDVQTALQRNNDYGSVTQEQWVLPSKYHTLCFISAQAITDIKNVDGEVAISLQGADISQASADLITRSLAQGVSTNLFLLSDSVVYPLGYSSYVVLNKEDGQDGLAMSNNVAVLCQEATNGRVRLRMEGLGRTTFVSFAGASGESEV